MLPPSAKLYLARALYDWCLDRGLTPYVSAKVEGASVPRGYDQDGVIVLNLGPEATNRFAFEPDASPFRPALAARSSTSGCRRKTSSRSTRARRGTASLCPTKCSPRPSPTANPTPPRTNREGKPAGKRGGGFLRVVK